MRQLMSIFERKNNVYKNIKFYVKILYLYTIQKIITNFIVCIYNALVIIFILLIILLLIIVNPWTK